MLPRISNLLENNEVEKVKKYIDKSIEFVSFLSIPIALGLIAVSKRFAPIFFGEEFRQTGIIIQYLATTVIFISWANVIRTQYLIPKEKDKIYIISVMSGAVINFIVNLILIPKYETIGAAIGTILAEFTVMLVQLVAVSKSINIVNYIRKFVTFAIKGIIMYILVYLCNYIDATDIIIVFLQVFVGIVTYSILNIRYIYISLNIKNLKEKILNKIKRKG